MKIGAVLFDESGEKIAVVRKAGKNTFIIPGGKPENSEDDLQALDRELREELCTPLADAEFFGEYEEPAEFGEGHLVMRVYHVKVDGQAQPHSEIEEVRWIDCKYAETGVQVGSTLRNHVIPGLRSKGLL